MRQQIRTSRVRHQWIVLTRRAVATAAMMLGAVALGACQDRKDIEVINACDKRVVVNLWENPDPKRAGGDDPERVVVPPLSTVTAKDALDDVDDNGSGAEIIEGPGRGEVLQLAHGARKVILPASLCAEAG